MRTSQSASSVAVSLRSVGATVSGVCGVWWCGSSLTKLAICTAEGTADTGAGAGGEEKKKKKRKKSWSKQGLTYRAPLKGNDATNIKDVRRREVVLSKGSQRIVAPHQIMTNEPSGTVLVCNNLCSPLTSYLLFLIKPFMLQIKAGQKGIANLRTYYLFLSCPVNDPQASHF